MQNSVERDRPSVNEMSDEMHKKIHHKYALLTSKKDEIDTKWWNWFIFLSDASDIFDSTEWIVFQSLSVDTLVRHVN